MRTVLSLILLLSGLAAPLPVRAGPQEACAYSAEVAGLTCLVLVEGRAVVSRADNGGSLDTAYPLASGTKGFAGIIAAALVEDGLLELDEPVGATIGEWSGDARRAVTVRQLLSLTSGIETPSPRLRDPDNIFPPAADALARPLVHAPGSHFAYGQAPFGIFAELVRRKLAGQTGEDAAAYLDRRILAPLAIEAADWRRGTDGSVQLAAGMMMTARDWARFGEFIRLGGVHDGRALVHPAALAALFEPSAVNPAYGLTWWLRPDNPRQVPSGIPMRNNDFWELEAGPRTIWIAAGAGKQRLYIIPERGIVAVRQAPISVGARPWRFSDVRFLELLLDL